MSAEEIAWVGLPAAIAISFAWRALGVAVSGRIRVDGPLFDWVRCVAFALLAGLVSRMLIFPEAVLREAALADRLGSVALGFLVFYLTGRNILLGLLAGVALFMLLNALVRG